MRLVLLTMTTVAMLSAQDVGFMAPQIKVATAGGFGFVSGELIGGPPLKGQPYSAQAVTETVQTLADGNRISQKLTASIYRDSEGRERREQSFALPATLSANVPPKQVIMISDPIAGANYSLNPDGHTAMKMPMPPALPLPPLPPGASTKKTNIFYQSVGIGAAGMPGPGPGPVMIYRAESGTRDSQNPPKAEQLGSKVIEGVETQGTRTTITIPAGQIGNDQPIQIVDERWFSTELQVTMWSQHSDPRMGTTTYSLTNVNRGEPSPALFQVPPDYTIKEGPGVFNIQKGPQ